jgi:hypothetical protein
MYTKLGYAIRILQQQKKITFFVAIMNEHGSLTLKGQMVVVKPTTKTASKTDPNMTRPKSFIAHFFTLTDHKSSHFNGIP